MASRFFRASFQQAQILGIPDISRSTGGIQDQCSFVGVSLPSSSPSACDGGVPFGSSSESSSDFPFLAISHLVGSSHPNLPPSKRFLKATVVGFTEGTGALISLEADEILQIRIFADVAHSRIGTV